MKRLLPILWLLFAAPVWATTYYIAATGSDSNNGTSKSTPWLHAPGMLGCTGNCASASPAAGDSIIFRGGDTWLDQQMLFTASGTSTNPIYIGVDQSWYTGSSWSRPIFNANNDPWPQQFQFGGDYIVLDNIEFTGLFWNDTAGGAVGYIAMRSSTGSTVEHSYFHGWTHSGTTDHCEIIYGMSDSGTKVFYNVFDGSDSTNGGDSCYGIYGIPNGEIAYNYFTQLSNGFVGYAQSFHDNTVNNLVVDYDVTAHQNMLENNTSPPNTMIYNNVFRHGAAAGSNVTLWDAAVSPSTDYIFDNVFYDTTTANILDFARPLSGSVGSTNFFDNTVECGPDSSPTAICAASIFGPVSLTNNQFVGPSADGDGNVYTLNGGTVTETTNIVQTKTTANGQGYTMSNGFAPTSGTNATVGAGTNQTSLCTTISGIDSAAGAACGKSTTFGVIYNTTNHTVSTPGVTPITRPSSGAWDAGAYQFGNGANPPIFHPVAGSYGPAQSVTITSTSTGAIICYNTTGSPATNGSTGCTTGTLYSGAVTVSSSETLYAVAGGTDYSDSGVSSAHYTINGAAATPTFSPAAGTYMAAQSVTISDSTPGASIYYTTDGSTPTTASTLYAGAITVFVSTTVKAIAAASGYSDSAVGSAAYTINLNVINLNSGMTTAQIQSALSGASNGATVNWAAGTYSITSTLILPCSNLQMTGPVATPPTAILSATFTTNAIFNYPANCSSLGSVQYLWGENTGFIYVGAGSSNLTVKHNQVTNLPSDTSGTYRDYWSGVFLDGSMSPFTTVSNVDIENNVFGDSNSCTAAFTDVTTDPGGFCAGVLVHSGATQNLTVKYNQFLHLEEGLHIFQLPNFVSGQPESYCVGCVVEYNHFLNPHRIAIEIQNGTPNDSTLVEHNDVVDPLNSFFNTFAYSTPCCNDGTTFGTLGYSPGLLFLDNIAISTQACGQYTCPPYGEEFWGTGAEGNNNLIQGNFANGIVWGYGQAPWQLNNNNICGIGNGNYIMNEAGQTNPPTQSGNVTGPTCSATSSIAPTISPNGGSFTGSRVVTLADSGANTSIYYTTDGSTPTTSSTRYTAPFTISSTTTVKTLGMWGQPNQPTSYPTNYGYVPSAVTTATFTSGGGGGGVAPTKIEAHAIPFSNTLAINRMSAPCVLPAHAGDSMFLIGTYGTGANVISSTTDNVGGNTWVLDQNISDGVNGQSIFIDRASSVASGTQTGVITMGSAQEYSGASCVTMNNISTPDGPGCSTSNYNGTNPSCALTTTQANDEVVCGVMQDSAGFTAYPVTFTSSTLTLLQTDPFIPFAIGVTNQASAGSFSPAFSSNTGGNWIMACQAYSTVASGGSEPTTPYVKQENEYNFVVNAPLTGTSFTVDYPALPGVSAIDIATQSNGNVYLNTLTSSPSCTWTSVPAESVGGAGGVDVQHWYTTGCSATNGMTLTFGLSATPSAATPLNAFTASISGLANVTALDTTCGSTGTFNAQYGTISNVLGSGCTTVNANDALVWLHQEYQQTVTSATASAGTESSLMGDYGTCAGEYLQQDEGLGTIATGAAGNYNVSVTYPNPPYCGANNVSYWAAQGLAWKATAAPAPPAALTVILVY